MTVQDRGRRGTASLGVPRAGSADELSAAVASLAVGLGPGDAVVEVAGAGGALRLGDARLVALAGDAELLVDGRLVAPGVVHRVEAGQVVGVGQVRTGARCYLAVQGGIEVPEVLGSRSSDLLCGLGPGRLEVGDDLGLGPAGPSRARFSVPPAPAALRVLPGPDDADGRAFAELVAQPHLVEGSSDRTGVRLRPSTGRIAAVRPVEGSSAMVTGAVQLPPDGRPIVLGVDHATLGGYPVVAVVATADRHLLGQLRPGDEVRLEAIGIDEALRLAGGRPTVLGRAVRGWFPSRAG